MNKQELQSIAEKYKYLYNIGACSREEAKENIIPYLDFINNKSKEIAKKYNQRHKKISFANYVR